MIVSQFSLAAVPGEQCRLLLTNLEDVALRFGLRFVTQIDSSLPASAITSGIRDALKPHGFEFDAPWNRGANGVYDAAGGREVAARATAVVGLAGHGDEFTPFGQRFVAGHVVITLPQIRGTSGGYAATLPHPARILLSGSRMRVTRRLPIGDGNYIVVPLEPPILLGDCATANGAAEQLVPPDTMPPVTRAGPVVKRRRRR